MGERSVGGAGAGAGGAIGAGPEGAAGAGASLGAALLHGLAAEGAWGSVLGGGGGGAGGDAFAGEGFGEAAVGKEVGVGAFEAFGEHHLDAGDHDEEGAGGDERVWSVEPRGEFGVLGEDVEGDVAVEVVAEGGGIEGSGENGAGVGVGIGPRGLAGQEKEGAEVAG